MASLAHLRTLILSAFRGRGLQNGEQEFFEELMAHKPQLVNLFDVGPRSPQEQREVETGKVVVNGRSLAVNADFARQVIFISQQLDCSERYVAGLLHDVVSQNPNMNQQATVEATIFEYHDRRRQLAECLRLIFEAAEASESSGMPPIYERVDYFVRTQLVPAAGGLSLPSKVFQEIHNLGNVLAKAQMARQNARSETMVPSAQNAAGTLGADVLNARCDALRFERQDLAVALYTMGRMGFLGSSDVKKMIDWLEANYRHPMTYYILPTVLAAFDLVGPDTPGAKARKSMLSDAPFISYMKKKLDVATEWKEPGVKAAVLLKWTLFLTEARHQNPALENLDGFKNDELETQIWNAVQGDCFTYLLRTVAQLQKKQAAYPPVSYAAALLSQPESEPVELPADDFKPAILETFEALVRSMIHYASSELRKIKQRQEDLLLAGTRPERTRGFRQSTTRFPAAPEPEKPAAPPRNDMAMLFSFIGLLYSTLPPERALPFWGSGVVLEGKRSTYSQAAEWSSGKLPVFLQWAVWSTQPRDLDMSMALYDMLSGLAKGQQCSELAYNFLARGGSEVIPGSSLASSTTGHFNVGPAVSWNSIFGLLDSWATTGTGARPTQPSSQVPGTHGDQNQQWHAQQQHQQHQHQPQPQQLVFTPQDVLLAQAFLHLLSTVVTWSVAVRVTICSHARFRAIPTLVSLIPLGIPLELKGAIFDTLASFCEPGAGIPGVEICKSVWTLMERLEVINVRIHSGAPIPAVKGVEVELDEVESAYKMYPATIPFLKLLATLIHTPKRVPIKNLIADAEPMNTIPEALGHPYRTPGIGPFTAFVVDNVFTRISTREYLRPMDRWRMNDLCLCFIERCLASYDLESLTANVEELQPKGDGILQLATHPGYDMMKRLLTSSPLQTNVLSYLVDGINGYERGLAEEEPYFRSTIIRVLRIIHRVLEIQDIFLDVLIPLLSEANEPAITGEVPPTAYFIRLEQALTFSREHVPAIAAYAVYPKHQELVLLSIKILTALANSPSHPQLALLIDRSDESLRILDGFQKILDMEVFEDVEAAETEAEQRTGAGALDLDETSDLLTQAVRVALLDLLVQNTDSTRPYPNVAHFLLFGSASAEAQIQDPHALGARRSCIHSVLDMLNAGIPRLKGKSRRHQIAVQPLFVTLPALAQRGYHLVHQLCKHPRTSEPVMRYLRTREDFFTRHLAAVPFKAPITEREPFIEVMYSDSSRVTTTVTDLASFLRLRSWILELAALELHVLTNKKHHKSVAQLLELLFGSEEDYLEEGQGWEDELFRPFHEVGQSNLRMIEFLQSLDFDWSDSLVVQPIELQFLGGLNLQSCIRVDESGCEIVDRAALLALLAAARRSLHMQGQIVTSSHLDQLTTEVNYIMESCAVENHRRKVHFASANGYEAWRRLLDTSLLKCFDRLPFDRRENMLFDLLHVLPPIIRSANVEESTSVLLSEAALSTITKLREDRHYQIILQTAGGDTDVGSLPAERLFTLLRSLLECILDNNRIELVRGNLYAALINYVHLVISAEYTQSHDDESGNPLNISTPLSSSLTREDLLSQSLSAATIQVDGNKRVGSALVNGSLAILKPVIERLVSTLSRDAIDGSEVWKTVAFMLLDSLVRLSRLERNTAVFQALSRHGFLGGFCQGLKESDLRLQAVLKPDPEDLNVLYVYEAKMSLLNRMAQGRQGAERLLEARVIPALAGCDYLDARPEADQAFLDQDSFLPSAIQRYHQLFMPAIELVAGMLVTLGPKHATATNQALQFLSAHRDTIVLLLKNEVDELSLPVLEEIRLLISLCGTVLKLVPKTELMSNSGFGGIHAAILSLAARCLSNRHWSDIVKPHTEAELIDAETNAPGFRGETKFRVSVRFRDQVLRRTIIAYLGTASDFTEQEFSLTLSPVVTSPRQEERPAKFLPTVPTVGDAIEALSHLCDDLSDGFKRIINLSAELASRDHTRVANVEQTQIVSVSDRSLLEHLDVRQKQLLINRELMKWKTEARRRTQIVLSAVEMLLLLLWRHLVFYAEGRHINNPDLKGAVSHMMRFVSAPDPGTFAADTQRKFAPVVQRLRSLELSEETLGRDWRSFESYLEIMSRRLEDAAGLAEAPENSQNLS
ncbi:hypothetical protein CERSUDRAFT_125016 [Gelatoporia subvermispora B]|uniref:Uncharacterized protein n=1 Tax=Ceriporiopsis subvermispora (strain B) TaxID=914234 RepID=M2R8J9_CERS8|nr:hypothetical protein CERSUDRAFT_125016 [Gelatoporia subvermispora B]